MAAKRILMGVIGRPHGVRGLVHVHSYAEGDLASYSPLWDEAGRAWTLAWRGDGIAELRDALAVGGPLPTVPLYLRGHGCVPLDLEATYAETRRRVRF